MDMRKLITIITAVLAGIGAAITGVVLFRRNRIY